MRTSENGGLDSGVTLKSLKQRTHVYYPTPIERTVLESEAAGAEGHKKHRHRKETRSKKH